ncbi:MAG TPA: hypothetical protein VF487_02050 [Chitinophagaceae bacterium]
MENLNQLQKEWAFLNASRELLSLVKKNPNVKYEDAIKFSKEIAPEILGNSKIGLKRKSRLEKIYAKCAQEALAKSREEERDILPEQIIEARIFEIERLLNQFTNNDDDPENLRREATDLKMLLKTEFNAFLNLERVTESQAILNDTYLNRADKIWVENHLGKFNTYRSRDDKSIFRVAVLHPNPSEAISGADLIYEQYNEENKKVRIVAMQYKIWENEILYFSQSGNLEGQLKRMEKCFCCSNLCSDGKNVKVTSLDYRFPYCCAFLRPTDKLQNPNKLITSGYHLPICKVNDVKTKGYKDYTIQLNNIKKSAIKTQTFEELFDAELLGSRWLEKKELEDLYRRTKVLEPSQRIILHAQNVVFETNDEDYF